MTQGSSTRRLRVHETSDALLFGSYGNIGVGIWRALPSLPAAERLGAEYGRMKADYGSFGVVILVESQVGLPDEPARKKLGTLMDHYGSSILCMGGVQEASGFKGAAIRSVITAISLLSAAPFPRKTFERFEEAASWVAPFCSKPGQPPLSPAALSAAIGEMRRNAAAG